jgi:hypothetical protein
MKLNMMRRRPVNLEVLPEYRDRVEEKLSRGGGRHDGPCRAGKYDRGKPDL